jgi:hypothetical protein
MPRDSLNPPGVVNRLRAVLLHVPYYSIQGCARLAADTSLSRATISRLCTHTRSPSYAVAEEIAQAISRRAGREIATGDIFSTSGQFPTPSACALMGCKGCRPPEAWSEQTDRLKNRYAQQKPGEWSRLVASPLHTGTSSIAASA